MDCTTSTVLSFLKCVDGNLYRPKLIWCSTQGVIPLEAEQGRKNAKAQKSESDEDEEVDQDQLRKGELEG